MLKGKLIEKRERVAQAFESFESRHGEEDALGSLLGRITVHERAGAVVPTDLLQFGFYASAITIATGVLALLWSDPESVRHGGFYLVLGGASATMTSLMKALAVPAICAGVLLLGVDLFLMKVRTSARWRAVIVGQAALGGAVGLIGTFFLALVLLNLVLWILIVMLALAVIGVFFAALAGG
jgi:hypothetical protein